MSTRARAITSTTRIELVAERRGAVTALAHLRGGDLLRPRPLGAAGPVARVALVQASASLLSGDRLELDVAIGPGATVELVEVAALVAAPVRDGPPARLAVTVTLGAGARLHWDARPLVLAAGCHLRRTIDLRLSEGAAVVLRDTLVLGRAGEAPGRLLSRTSAAIGGTPLHDEGLDTGDLAVLRSPAVLGRAGVLDVVALYGRRAEAPCALQLDGPGTIAMTCAADAADARASIDPVHRAWARTLLGCRGDDCGHDARDGRHEVELDAPVAL